MSDEQDGLAAMVLERMSQDSGPADCEPFTGWCVDLAREVLALLDEVGRHEKVAEAARWSVKALRDGGLPVRLTELEEALAALEARR